MKSLQGDAIPVIPGPASWWTPADNLRMNVHIAIQVSREVCILDETPVQSRPAAQGVSTERRRGWSSATTQGATMAFDFSTFRTQLGELTERLVHLRDSL